MAQSLVSNIFCKEIAPKTFFWKVPDRPGKTSQSHASPLVDLQYIEVQMCMNRLAVQ